MARSVNPDPLGQFITNISAYGTETAVQIAQAGGGLDTDGGVTQGIDSMADGVAGSGLTTAAGDRDAGSNTGLGGSGLNAASSLVSKAQQGAALIANPKAAADLAISKITAGIPALGKIAGIAGGVNNILGLFRSRNIPTAAETIFGREAGAYIEVKQGFEEDWRIRIDCNFSLFSGAFPRLEATSGLVWPYLPNITVVSKANYTQQDPVHNNQPFQAYKNSQVEDIQISGDFSVENESDAEYWIQATTFLRTSTKMFFGQGPNVGNPPVICNLTGYGSRVFNNVPVIIKSFSIDFKEDVNYIRYQGGDTAPTWVPALSTIAVTVAPIYNRTRLRKFNLQDFANGRAVGYI
jgi:hypothetical protein